MVRIRGGSGLGDSIYMRPVVEHYARAGEVRVLSDYPHVFLGIERARVLPFERIKAEVIAHYVGGKSNPYTNQWQDVCASAKVPGLAFTSHWSVRNTSLVKCVMQLAKDRPIVLVHGGRVPMGRRDGFGRELIPEKGAFDWTLGNIKDCFLIRIGQEEQQLYDVRHHWALNGGSTVSDILDLASVCSAVVGQCSFAVPLAELFGKPLLAVWSSKGLMSQTPFIRAITPQKILSSKASQYVVDDWPQEKIAEVCRAFHFL